MGTLYRKDIFMLRRAPGGVNWINIGLGNSLSKLPEPRNVNQNT